MLGAFTAYAALSAGSHCRSLHSPHWERTLARDSSRRDALYNLAQALKDLDAARAREYRDRFAAVRAERRDADRVGALRNFALAAAK